MGEKRMSTRARLERSGSELKPRPRSEGPGEPKGEVCIKHGDQVIRLTNEEAKRLARGILSE